MSMLSRNSDEFNIDGQLANGRLDPPDALLPQHVDDLRKSGLSDATIQACGFRSITGSRKICNILHWKNYPRSLGPALAIPFRRADGTRDVYCRLKLDNPRRDKSGKLVRYESPKGEANKAYFPPSTLASLSDASSPILIAEGEKKSAKADQEGFPCIGLVGVYGFQKKRERDATGRAVGERELIDELQAVAWRGRGVHICFDSDAADNPNVRWAEWHLAEILTRHGAKVKILRLPPGEPDTEGKPAKVGLDDFLVAFGPERLRELLATAQEPTRPHPRHPSEGEVREGEDDPHRLARLCQDAERPYRYWREEFCRWDGQRYQTVLAKEIRAKITETVKAEFDRLNLAALARHQTREEASEEEKSSPPPQVRRVTTKLIGDVLQALTGLAILPSSMEAPDWIDGGPWPASEVLAAPNALIHLPSLINRKPDFSRPPTPQYFSFNVLDYRFDLRAPKPSAWLEFLGQLWPDDRQSIETLQDWFGYLLTIDTSLQKILLLLGPRRSGKGTIARIIAEMVGKFNVAGPTLSSLATNFGLWPLLGKSVGIISDARLSRRTDTAIVERLLSVSGEDRLAIDRKYLTPLTVKLPTRLVILTNEIPKLGDASGALAGRLILLHLAKSWYGRENTKLTGQLIKESPGILLWAIAGWERLNQRGHFVQPASGLEFMEDLEELSSPVGAFVKECCLLGSDYQIPKTDLFQTWRAWCNQCGIYPGDAATFGRNLLASAPTVRDGRPRTDGGERTHVYLGIARR